MECERIWILYVLDRTTSRSLMGVPYRDPRPHGLFAPRAPARHG
jgi:tRNA (Thr-GGU) A37 N-methylase